MTVSSRVHGITDFILSGFLAQGRRVSLLPNSSLRHGFTHRAVTRSVFSFLFFRAFFFCFTENRNRDFSFYCTFPNHTPTLPRCTSRYETQYCWISAIQVLIVPEDGSLTYVDERSEKEEIPGFWAIFSGTTNFSGIGNIHSFALIRMFETHLFGLQRV